jgi:hypothetical protein
MGIARFRLTFADIVDSVCKKPQTYTLNGTFGEALAFLDGLGYNAYIREPNRSSSSFTSFGEWLQVKLNYPDGVPLLRTFQESHKDDSEALKEFARLWRLYSESQVAKERLIWINDMRWVDSVEEITALPSDTEAVSVRYLADSKIAALAKLKGLRRLMQQPGSSRVTDEGLRMLGSIESLEELDLEWSDLITDDGLQHLSSLHSLRWLDVGFCRRLTAIGVEHLRSQLSQCEVVTSFAL